MATATATGAARTGGRSGRLFSSTTTLMFAATLLCLIACFSIEPASAFPRICGNSRNHHVVSDVKQCRYGWEEDICGHKSCSKGPGETCGGKDQRYGVCGEGLMCSNCNRCQGCSFRTFRCYNDRNCIWSRRN